MGLWQNGQLMASGGSVAETAFAERGGAARGLRQWRQISAVDVIHLLQVGQRRRSEGGRALSRSRLQYLQTMAWSWMSSAQNGHFLTVASRFDVFPVAP